MSNSKEMFFAFADKISAYSREEARSVTHLIFEHFFGLSTAQIMSETALPENADEMIFPLLERVNRSEPVQYILGEADFLGRKFRVTPDVLIPRPETEELVVEAIRSLKGIEDAPSVLDIGTGSGCIPITIALEVPEAVVAGIDISEAALAVAKENATRLNTKVGFSRVDILNEPLPFVGLDRIISNPPYISPSEIGDMHPNVVTYEPHLALFSPQDDPLIFYRMIAQKAIRALRPGGLLFLELNAFKAEEIRDIVSSFGFVNVELIKDLSGKKRMLKASRRLENSKA